MLFVLSLADRIVEVLGVTARPDEAWIMQIGRNLVDTESGALRGDITELGRAVAAAFDAGAELANGSYLAVCGGTYSSDDFVATLNALGQEVGSKNDIAIINWRGKQAPT